MGQTWRTSSLRHIGVDRNPRTYRLEGRVREGRGGAVGGGQEWEGGGNGRIRGGGREGPMRRHSP